jgi:cobalt-zinc-cadmium efflux system outer membrane protein
MHDLALAYATAEVSQSRVNLLAEDLDRTQEDVRRARALVDAGKEGELRAVQANAAAAGARADLEEARATAVESLNQLSSLVGAREPFTSIGPSLLASASAAPAPTAMAPASAPAVLTAQAELEAAERRIQVERKRALPALALSVGARRFKGENAAAMVGGVSLSLPLFDQNRGAIASARAERSAADARLVGARLDADAAWRAASAQQNAAAARLTATSQGEAAANEAYRLARIGYEAGRSSLLELLSTRRSLIEAQLRSLDARLARVRAEASLALLAGQVPFGE